MLQLFEVQKLLGDKSMMFYGQMNDMLDSMTIDETRVALKQKLINKTELEDFRKSLEIIINDPDYISDNDSDSDENSSATEERMGAHSLYSEVEKYLRIFSQTSLVGENKINAPNFQQKLSLLNWVYSLYSGVEKYLRSFSQSYLFGENKISPQERLLSIQPERTLPVHFFPLPTVLYINIFSFLSLQTLVSVSQVNKLFNETVDSLPIQGGIHGIGSWIVNLTSVKKILTANQVKTYVQLSRTAPEPLVEFERLLLVCESKSSQKNEEIKKDEVRSRGMGSSLES